MIKEKARFRITEDEISDILSISKLMILLCRRLRDDMQKQNVYLGDEFNYSIIESSVLTYLLNRKKLRR